MDYQPSDEGQSEAFVGATSFQKFGDGLDNGAISFLFKELYEFWPGVIQEQYPVQQHGIAREVEGVFLGNNDPVFGWNMRFDGFQGSFVESGGKIHDLTIQQGTETGVEMVETGIDQVQGDNLQLQLLG